MACWSTKAAISLKRVKIEKKIWRAYYELTNALTTYIFWTTPIISGTGEATEFKFGWHLHRVYPNKRPLKILEKGERGRIHGLSSVQILCAHTRDRSEQNPSKISGKVAVGVVRDSRKLSVHPYIRRIAGSSLR